MVLGCAVGWVRGVCVRTQVGLANVFLVCRFDVGFLGQVHSERHAVCELRWVVWELGQERRKGGKK